MRCPEPVEKFAALYSEELLPANRAALKGVDSATLKIVFAATGQHIDRVRHELDELRRAGARPPDIAVVSLGGQLRSELFGKSELGSHKLVHADSPEAGKHVISDTFLRFKGLERPFVIVTELDLSMPQYLVRMRIALTRATVGLTVVCSRDQAEHDPRLLALE